MNDPLEGVAQSIKFDLVRGTIRFQRLHLKAAELLLDGQVLIEGGYIVIGGGDGLCGTRHFDPSLIQTIKSLGAGDLVNEMLVDI